MRKASPQLAAFLKRLNPRLSVRDWITWFKAVLALVLTYIFFLTPAISSWMQLRDLYWMVFTNIVGTYLYISGLSACIFIISAGMWCFLQGVCGSQHYLMGIGLFPYIYLLSLMRAQSHDRYFQVAIFGILISYISTAGETGVLGPDSSWGDQLDYNYLADTMISYFMGLGIGLFVNLCVLPDFGEWHLNDMLSEIFLNMAELSRASTACLICSGFSQDEYLANCETRNKLVSAIQKTFRKVDSTIEHASREISYSKFSTADYSSVAQQAKSVAATLFSINTVLNGPEALRLVRNPVYQSNVTIQMQAAWRDFDTACSAVFEGMVMDLEQPADEVKVETGSLVLGLDAATNVALDEFSIHKPAVFSTIFEHADVGLDDCTTQASKDAWEKFAQLNFHDLATQEFVKELKSLHQETHSRAQEHRRVRFHFGFTTQVKSFFRHAKIHAANAFRNPSRSSARKALSSFKDFLVSDNSIYAFKSAIAIMLFQLTLLISTNTYDHWYFERGLAPIAVAMGPSLGQTYSTLIPRILGTVFGGTVGYCGVLVFGKDSPWHILIGFFQMVPVFYVNFFYPQHAVLARLCLISYTMYLFITIAYEHDPTFPDPSQYLMKLVTVISVALVYATIFATLIFPMTSRKLLRSKLATIFTDLNVFYRKIVSRRTRTVELDARMSKIEEAETKDFRNEIFSQLVALNSLMHYCTLEPRLEGPFQETDYKEIVDHQYQLLDRLECLRLCIGDEPFDPKIKQILKFGAYGEARAEMHQNIRVLLFISASTMLTKLRLLPNLPKASHSRDKMIEGFVSMLLQHSQPHEYDGSDPFDGVMPVDRKGMLEALNSPKWVRVQGMSVSLREVSRVLDETIPYLKSLFGEAPDILDPEDEALLPIVIGKNEYK
ncbi:hypothetical protein HDU98_008655 [Podochytrium sp. JEL0797]|nr:hypothetical protein HDU98_008655 [Podochytrium sp. JEL0797]